MKAIRRALRNANRKLSRFKFGICLLLVVAFLFVRHRRLYGTSMATKPSNLVKPLAAFDDQINLLGSANIPKFSVSEASIADKQATDSKPGELVNHLEEGNERTEKKAEEKSNGEQGQKVVDDVEELDQGKDTPLKRGPYGNAKKNEADEHAQDDAAKIRSGDAQSLSPVGTGKPSPRENIHVAYQIACSAYSLHQSIAVDWSWEHVKHPGKITRIVCGCTNKEDEDRMRTSPLEGDSRYNVYFSEDWNQYVPKQFPQAKGDSYHAYNHAFGLADWLLHDPPAEDFVAYMEPDMVFVNPILHHLSVADGGQAPQVTLGHPVGQRYHYVRPYCPMPCRAGDPGWAEFAIPEVCGERCPKRHISDQENDKQWSVGPPTILHKNDWKQLAPLWSNYSVEIRVRAREKSDGVSWLGKGARVYIAEMLAYALAAAALNLPHGVVRDLTADAVDPCQYSPLKSGCSPKLVHYCYPQNTKTSIGHWIWNKYRMPIGYGQNGPSQWKNPLFWDCDMPLLEEPPANALAPETWKNGANAHVMWMIVKIIESYNGGTLVVKTRRCHGQVLEERKIMLVTEQDSFVPRKSVKDQPLPERLQRRFVKN